MDNKNTYAVGAGTLGGAALGATAFNKFKNKG
jgi:hypothetical protein